MTPIKYPKISIITPSLNQGRFIKETIESVLSQDYPNLEYWIIDGGSTDETLRILKSFGRKIKWVSEKDGSQTKAINKGLKKVSGDIIAYLNSDDVYLPNTFNTVADYFLSHGQAAWLSGNYFIIDEKGRKIQSFVAAYKTFLRSRPTLKRLTIANYIIQPSTFWRKEVVQKIGSFDPTLSYAMDYDYWMRIIQEFPLHVLDNHFSLFRIHNVSKSKNQFEKQFNEEYQVIKRYEKNPILLFLHKLHNGLIILTYKLIK